jgi:PAS domain S-box-containing protein
MASLWNKVRTVLNLYRIGKDSLISLVDRDGNLYSMNAEMRRLLNLTAADKKKSTIFELLEADEVNKFKRSFLQCEKKNLPSTSTINFKNGSNHRVHLKIHALSQTAGKTQLFLCVGEEVKENNPLNGENRMHIKINPADSLSNQLADHNLQPGQALILSALMNSPALTWMINEEEELIFANTAFKKYFFLPDSAINQDIRKYIPYQVIQGLYDKHINALISEKPVSSREKSFLADGSIIHFQVFLFTTTGNNNKKIIAGQAFLIPDLSPSSSFRLEEENALINNISSDAIWEWDMRSGRIIRNNSLQQMIGFPLNESNGLAWWLRRIHAEDRDRVSEKVKKATEEGLLSWEDAYRFKCADGSYKHIHDHGYIFYENGMPAKMIGSLQDVSEIKKLQSLLEKEKKERQQELSETVLHVQERERARIGYELHDNINQILTTVNLFVEQLKVEGPEQISLKNKSIGYLLNAIEEIRTLSKGLVVPHLKEKGLAESIQTMIDDFHISHKMRIDFFHDCPFDKLTSGKKITLFRIVQEQLKNILKYSGASNAEVSLQCKDGFITLMVSDDGKGFDPKLASRGIGLSNIFERSRFYNGSANIDTAPGKGCILTVRIPLE